MYFELTSSFSSGCTGSCIACDATIHHSQNFHGAVLGHNWWAAQNHFGCTSLIVTNLLCILLLLSQALLGRVMLELRLDAWGGITVFNGFPVVSTKIVTHSSTRFGPHGPFNASEVWPYCSKIPLSAHENWRRGLPLSLRTRLLCLKRWMTSGLRAAFYDWLTRQHGDGTFLNRVNLVHVTSCPTMRGLTPCSHLVT